MTVEANTKWDYQDLTEAVRHMEHLVTRYREQPDADGLLPITASELKHAIEFIEYNMREMEINDWNGD